MVWMGSGLLDSHPILKYSCAIEMHVLENHCKCCIVLVDINMSTKQYCVFCVASIYRPWILNLWAFKALNITLSHSLIIRSVLSSVFTGAEQCITNLMISKTKFSL